MFKFDSTKIAEAREARGMSQAALARIVCSNGRGSRQAVGQWESGERRPSAKTIERIANALSINPADLFVETDEEEEGDAQ